MQLLENMPNSRRNQTPCNNAALLSFVAPEHLHRQQLGYRWIGMSEPYQEAPSWKINHVVIANFNDDPLIVDTAAPNSPVYAAFTGEEPQLIADSLNKPEYLAHVEPVLNELLGEEHTAHVFEYLSFR